MKKQKMSIVTAWNWFINVIDTNILTSSEQLVLVHLIKFLNRNFWKPINIETSILAKSTNKDNRTVKKALTVLINRGFIVKSDKGLNINYGTEETGTSNEFDGYSNFGE